MSSGSYFPPPVKRVQIAKRGGIGTRPLGIPTVTDRVAQAVVKAYLEPELEKHFHPDSYGYRPGKSALQQWELRESVAGDTPGLSIWTSAPVLIRFHMSCYCGR